MRHKNPFRLVYLAPLIAACALPLLAQKLEGPKGGCSSNPSVQPRERARYRALREFDDPATLQHWILIRDVERAAGPALLVKDSQHFGCEFIAVGKGNSPAAVQERFSTLPIIHAGDRIILSEHGINFDAELEATALDAAAAGDSLRVRIKFGGRTVRAIAVARGHASRGAGSNEEPAMKSLPFISSILILAAFTSLALHASKKQKATEPLKTPPEVALHSYIDRVRAQHAAEVSTSGSIWSPDGRFVRLGTDAKASRVHDVVSIVVIESLAASTDGQVKNVRASNASSSVTSLFGALKAANSLQNLVGQNSSSGLTAQGQSTTNSSLATTFGGEVVDVLPNGMLVVQATRQLTFSQQTQLIKLRGLVRPEDVSAQNQVLSTSMTDLELEVTGKGIVSDSTYRQNPLVRWLEKLLVF